MTSFKSKDFFFQLIYILCLFVPFFNNYELTFIIWFFTFFISISYKYSTTIIKQVLSFIAILIIAFVVMFFHDYERYYIIRDITYLLKPILGLLIGYQLCKKIKTNSFKIIVFTGLLMAIYHIILLLLAVTLHHAFTVNDIRLYAGYFNDYEIYVLVILLFNKQFQLNYTKREIIFYSIIIGFSSLMYMARTNFIQFVILFLAMRGYLKINKRALKIIVSVVLLSFVGYATILYINPRRNGKGVEALLYKIKIAPIEPFKTKIKRDDWKDFNDNYRSYESIMTIRQMSHDSYFAILFGEGIGSKVDLRQKVFLGDMEIRYVSFLHNGFMTVFLKSGILGIFILFYSIKLLYKKVRSDLYIVNQINLLLIGSGVFLIISYFVFLGLYFVVDTKSILIGFLISYREIKIKQNKLLPIHND